MIPFPMAFHFTLSGLLRLRESLERAELQKLQAIAAVVTRTRGEIEAVELEIEKSFRTFHQTLESGSTAAELHFQLTMQDARHALRSQLAERLAGEEQQRKEQQARYLQALKRREILSNLRERQLTKYEQEQSRRAQQLVDELFLIRKISLPSSE